MKVTVYDDKGQQLMTLNLAHLDPGEARVKIELDDKLLLVKEVDGCLLYRSEGAFVDEPTVHLVWNGVALCTVQGAPIEWPHNHTWIALEASTRDHHKVNCAACKLRAVEVIDGLKNLGKR